MSEDNTYEGWSYYCTWAVKLWIDNDEGCYNYWREQAREVFAIEPLRPELSVMSHEQACALTLAGQLQDEHEEGAENYIEGGSAACFGHLLGYALGCVNWHEIAESLIQEVKEEADYQASTHGGS